MSFLKDEPVPILFSYIVYKSCKHKWDDFNVNILHHHPVYTPHKSMILYLVD